MASVTASSGKKPTKRPSSTSCCTGSLYNVKESELKRKASTEKVDGLKKAKLNPTAELESSLDHIEPAVNGKIPTNSRELNQAIEDTHAKLSNYQHPTVNTASETQHLAGSAAESPDKTSSPVPVEPASLKCALKITSNYDETTLYDGLKLDSSSGINTAASSSIVATDKAKNVTNCNSHISGSISTIPSSDTTRPTSLLRQEHRAVMKTCNDYSQHKTDPCWDHGSCSYCGRRRGHPIKSLAVAGNPQPRRSRRFGQQL